MKKIISLFQRNYDGDRLVRDEVVPGAEWVLAGEGVATRKWDGTCCLVRDGLLFKRYDLPLTKADQRRRKSGHNGPDWHHIDPPVGWEPAQENYDLTSGHWPGWVPVGDGTEDRWHLAAWALAAWEGRSWFADGTYELVGPKVQGNPEKVADHRLIPHGAHLLPDAPRDFAGIRDYLAATDIEGIVWHHPDGRMVKIKAKDFWLKRGAGESV